MDSAANPVVYTKDINVGIYDLLQEQFGSTADQTTVYSYIFRICEHASYPINKEYQAHTQPLQTLGLPLRRQWRHLVPSLQ